MDLKIGAPSLDAEEQALALELERTMALQHGTINFAKSHQKIDQLADGAIKCLSEDEQTVVKKAISEGAYKKCGNSAVIQDLHYDVEKNKVSATVNFAYELNVDLNKSGFSKSPEAQALLGQVQGMEREHQQLEKNCDYLGSMINKAIDSREADIALREQEIEEASHGVKGLWNKLTGQVPEPIPSLEEVPLTKQDITEVLRVAEVKTDHFLELLDERLPDIQQDAPASLNHLEELVGESRGKLENLTAQATAAVRGVPMAVEVSDNTVGSHFPQSDIKEMDGLDMPNVASREVTDEELARLDAQLAESTANNTIPDKAITDADIARLDQELKAIDDEGKSLLEKTGETITENLKVEADDDSYLANAKRKTAVGVAAVAGAGKFVADTAEGLADLGMATAKGVGTGYMGLADELSGGRLSENFDAFKSANENNQNAHDTAEKLAELAVEPVADLFHGALDADSEARERTIDRIEGIGEFISEQKEEGKAGYQTADISKMIDPAAMGIDALTAVAFGGITKAGKLGKIADKLDDLNDLDKKIPDANHISGTARIIEDVEDLINARRIENQSLMESPRFNTDLEKVNVSKQQIELMQDKKLPLGFKAELQFVEFKNDLNHTLIKVGLDDADIGLKGTSTTFYSENPSKQLGHHWDANPEALGDYDLNISSQKMIDKLNDIGIQHDSKYGIYKTRDIIRAFPELADFVKKWEIDLGREVNFVGYPKIDVVRDETEYLLRTIKD